MTVCERHVRVVGFGYPYLSVVFKSYGFGILHSCHRHKELAVGLGNDCLDLRKSYAQVAVIGRIGHILETCVDARTVLDDD